MSQKEIQAIDFKFKNLSKDLPTKKDMELAALLVKDSIFVRTSSGVSSAGTKFSGYSKRYAKREGKKVVNLQRTGKMLGAMTQKAISKNEGVVFFSNREASNLADIHHNKGVGKKKITRKFFAPSNQDRDKIFNYFKNVALSAIKQAGF